MPPKKDPSSKPKRPPEKPIRARLEEQEAASRVDFANGEHWFAIAKKEYEKDQNLDRVITVEVLIKNVPVKQDFPIKTIFNWAIHRFQKVLKDAALPWQEGKYAFAYECMAHAQCFLGKHAEAIAKLTEATAQYRTSPALWCRLGYAYHLSGQYDKAHETYKKAIEVKKSFALTYRLMGDLFADQKPANPHKKSLDYYAAYHHAARGREETITKKDHDELIKTLERVVAQEGTRPSGAPHPTAAKKTKVKAEAKAAETSSTAAATAHATTAAAAKPKKSPSLTKAKSKDLPPPAAAAAAAVEPPAIPPPTAKPKRSVKEYAHFFANPAAQSSAVVKSEPAEDEKLKRHPSHYMLRKSAVEPLPSEHRKPKRTASRISSDFFKPAAAAAAAGSDNDSSYVASPSSASPPEAYQTRLRLAAAKKRDANTGEARAKQVKRENSLVLHLTQTDDEATQPQADAAPAAPPSPK